MLPEFRASIPMLMICAWMLAPTVLKLEGWGLRPWMEFAIDPSSGQYTKRRLKSDPSWQPGYSGWGQELKVAGLGTVLCSVFLHEGEIILRLGNLSWNLFEPGLLVTVGCTVSSRYVKVAESRSPSATGARTFFS